jgi:hypothetical protein
VFFCPVGKFETQIGGKEVILDWECSLLSELLIGQKCPESNTVESLFFEVASKEMPSVTLLMPSVTVRCIYHSEC